MATDKEAPCVVLRSGTRIPAIGFGPGMVEAMVKNPKKRKGAGYFIWRVYRKLYLFPACKRKFTNAIATAFKNGFRLLDYSNTYRFLPLVKEAIAKSGMPREELFITTRVSNKAQINGNVREEVLAAIKDLGVKSVDMLQFHWPVTGKFVDTWKEMIRLRDEGYVRVLGVANCHPHHLEELEKATGELPEVNQVEVHPLFTQKPLLEYCRSRNITVEAYTPVARYDDRLVRLPLLRKLEQKYHKSFIQIILRWHVQNGVIPVVRALNPAHQRSNINIFDFRISDEDMALIDGININSRMRYDPDNCDFTIL